MAYENVVFKEHPLFNVFLWNSLVSIKKTYLGLCHQRVFGLSVHILKGRGTLGTPIKFYDKSLHNVLMKDRAGHVLVGTSVLHIIRHSVFT